MTKKNKQTNISHTDKLVICNMQFLLLYFYTWLENWHFWDTEQVCSERKQPQWIYKWRVYCKIWMMLKKFKTLWWQDGLFSTTRFANSTEIFFTQKLFVPFHFGLQEMHKMNKHSLQLINLGNTYLLSKGYKQVYFINYWSQEKQKSVFLPWKQRQLNNLSLLSPPFIRKCFPQ